jgi:hypothetical protein
MTVEIFSVQLLNKPGYLSDPAEDRDAQIGDLRVKVNGLVSGRPGARVEWLQSSAASQHGSYTQLTAIVTY